MSTARLAQASSPATQKCTRSDARPMIPRQLHRHARATVSSATSSANAEHRTWRRKRQTSLSLRESSTRASSSSEVDGSGHSAMTHLFTDRQWTCSRLAAQAPPPTPAMGRALRSGRQVLRLPSCMNASPMSGCAENGARRAVVVQPQRGRQEVGGVRAMAIGRRSGIGRMRVAADGAGAERAGAVQRARGGFGAAKNATMSLTCW
jgi:hypothetical protein